MNNELEKEFTKKEEFIKNELEKRFMQKDINLTPKAILEDLFVYMEERRCNYEEQELKFRTTINEIKTIIKNLQQEVKESDEYSIKTVKSISKYIKEQKKEIEMYKRAIRLIKINCDILWKNELKADKILGYGLES